jgi:hypothetical protein
MELCMALVPPLWSEWSLCTVFVVSASALLHVPSPSICPMVFHAILNVQVVAPFLIRNNCHHPQ